MTLHRLPSSCRRRPHAGRLWAGHPAAAGAALPQGGHPGLHGSGGGAGEGGSGGPPGAPAGLGWLPWPEGGARRCMGSRRGACREPACSTSCWARPGPPAPHLCCPALQNPLVDCIDECSEYGPADLKRHGFQPYTEKVRGKGAWPQGHQRPCCGVHKRRGGQMNSAALPAPVLLCSRIGPAMPKLPRFGCQASLFWCP